MRRESINEIINLKAHKQMLEAECGLYPHHKRILSRNQLHEMEMEICRANPYIALRNLTRILDEEEVQYRRFR